MSNSRHHASMHLHFVFRRSFADVSLGIKSAASRRTSSSSNNQTIPEEMDVLAAGSNTGASAGIHGVGRHRLSMDSANDPASAGLGGLLPPPPTYSRLPPDGHEFPQDYRDPQTGFTVQVRIRNVKNGAVRPVAC